MWRFVPEHQRDYKIEAHKMAETLFSRSDFDRAIATSTFEEICERASRVVQATNLVFPNEKMKLRDGLKSKDGQMRFAKGLRDLLFKESSLEERFGAFYDTLAAIGADKWTVSTYFLFIFKPREHMFMKPVVTQRAAELCAFELNYRPQPNWLTYNKLLIFAKYLKKELSDLEPRDMIDVQSFIWCTGEERGD